MPSHLYTQLPTIVDIYLDRPAIIPDIIHNAAAVLASYGSDDTAFLDIVFGEASPHGTPIRPALLDHRRREQP